MQKFTSAAVAIAAAFGAHAQISTNSIDTFAASNEGWRVGNAGVNPTAEGGTSFDGDPGFLRHFSDNNRANSRFIMWTEDSDWTGNYIDAGVTGISLWADGRAGDDLPFWLAFDGDGGWFHTPAQTIITAEGWTRFDFALTPESLIHVGASGGTGIASDTLSDVTRFEIFAGPGSVAYASRGDILRADRSENVVWFDNIAAVPTPGTVGLAGVAALAAAARRRRA